MNPTEPNYHHIVMAKTAGTFSFLAVITTFFCTVVLPYIFGGLSIIFAVISKGSTAAYQLRAKIAILVSCFAIIGNTMFTGFVFYNVMYNEEYHEQLNETFEQMYGMSMEEYMNETLGISIE